MLSINALVDVLLRFASNQGSSSDSDLAQLIEMFPEKSLIELKRVLNEAGNLEDAISTLINPANTSRLKGYVSIHDNEPPVSNAWSEKDGYKKIKSESTNVTDCLEPLHSYQNQGDPNELREKARSLVDKRNSLFNQAANSFSKRDFTGRSSASYYAQQGHALANEINQYNSLACESIKFRNA